MQTSLAYLDRAVETALTERLEDPSTLTKSDPSVHRLIRGIKVVDPKAVSDRIMQIEAYRDDAAALRARLSENGITVLAMLPKAAWEIIAKEAKLLRFTPNEDGSVPASTALLDNIDLRAKDVIGICGLIAVFASTTLFAGLGLFVAARLALPLWGTLSVMFASALLGTIITGGVIRALLYIDDEPRADLLASIEQNLILKAFKGRKDTLMQNLWPHEGFDTSRAVSLKINMPPAPMDAQENLLKAHEAGYQLTLYTVPEAISFIEDPSDVFVGLRSRAWRELDSAQKQAVERARAERAAKWQDFKERVSDFLEDPIVTIDCESVTAIIVQYGDFPIERETIDRVLASGQLL